MRSNANSIDFDLGGRWPVIHNFKYGSVSRLQNREGKVKGIEILIGPNKLRLNHATVCFDDGPAKNSPI